MTDTYDDHYARRCDYCATTSGPLARVTFIRLANRADDGYATACPVHEPHVMRGLDAAESVEFVHRIDVRRAQ